jgi:hypothetical protein
MSNSAVGVNDVLNSAICWRLTINDKTPIGGTNVYNVAARGSSLDQYYYRAARAVTRSA